MDQNPFEEKANTALTDAENEKATKEASIKKAVLQTVISVAVIAIVGSLLVLLFKVIPGVGTFFSNIFTKKEQITLSVSPQPVTSPNSVTITIKHLNEKDHTGAYSFTYGCVDDFHFDVPHATGTPVTSLPCNQMIYLSSSTPIVLAPILSKGDKVSVPFSVSYSLTATSSTPVTGTTNITVLKAQTSGPVATTTTPTPKPLFPMPTIPQMLPIKNTPVIYPTTKPTINNNPDLAVRIIALGIINPTDGQVIPRSYITPGERAAVRFQVINLGRSSSGSWDLWAQLPSYETPFYQSGAQMALYAGQASTYTISFTFAPQYYRRLTITVDPRNAISEMSKTNNTVIINF